MRKRIHTNTRFDDYLDCEVINKFHGGNGSKFLMNLNNHFFTLKVARDSTEESIEIFQREAENVMHNGGNNGTILFDYSGSTKLHEGELPWILLDYIPSVSLHSLLETLRCSSSEGYKLDICDFLKLKIVFSIAYILRNMHRNGSVHRDIKPHNIIIDSRLNTHICGFTMLSTKPTKSIKSTLNFMPPEFYRDDNDNEMIPCNPASDVFMFGGTLQQIVTFHWPFDDPKDFGVDVLKKYTSKGIADTRFDDTKDMPDINKDLYEIVKKCRAFNPSDRPTMDEISREIYEIAENRLSKTAFDVFNKFACSLRPDCQEFEEGAEEYEDEHNKKFIRRKIKMFPLGTPEKIVEALETGIGGMKETEILNDAARFIKVDIDEYQDRLESFISKNCVKRHVLI